LSTDDALILLLWSVNVALNKVSSDCAFANVNRYLQQPGVKGSPTPAPDAAALVLTAQRTDDESG
jgi:hypothetical protein